MTLGKGIKAALKIRTIFLRIATPSDGVRLVVLIHAARGEDSAMNIHLVAGVCQVERTDGIGSHRLRLIIFTPVDVGPASASSSVKDVRWLG